MLNRFSPSSLVRLSGLLAVLAWSAACSSSPTPTPTVVTSGASSDGLSVLEVSLVGFRSDRGSALVGLYLSADGFPDDGGKATERREVLIENGAAIVKFESLRAGKVAVGVLHDEDGNKTMKTGLFGRPKEGYGVSRDAPARFGPPSYSDAVIELRANAKTSIQVSIRY